MASGSSHTLCDGSMCFCSWCARVLPVAAQPRGCLSHVGREQPPGAAGTRAGGSPWERGGGCCAGAYLGTWSSWAQEEGPTPPTASLGLCHGICRSREHGGSHYEPPLVVCSCNGVKAEACSAAAHGSETADPQPRQHQTASPAPNSLLAVSQPLAVPAGKP